MNNCLYIFNPEHDLVLANGDRNFNPPVSARMLAADLACLPLWYADDCASVCVPSVDWNWVDSNKALFPQIRHINPVQTVEGNSFAHLKPWGWDKVVYQRMFAAVQRLPNQQQLAKIRDLSHRRTALQAHSQLIHALGGEGILSRPATEISDLDAVQLFADKWKSVVFKAPWSGSGKGLRWLPGNMTESHRGWCRNIIAAQGSVIAEQKYELVQDFAMEFSCNKGDVCWIGYSLFQTEKGIYRGNQLLSNDAIENILLSQGADPWMLNAIKLELINFLKAEVAPHYDGPLGVDMFLYSDAGSCCIHPCVEINLRMTMGYVARVFTDRFVASDKKGWFFTDHFQDAQSLMSDHLSRQQTHPLRVADGRIQEGYLPLSCPMPSSTYRIRVEID